MPCASCGGNKNQQSSANQANFMGNRATARRTFHQTNAFLRARQPVKNTNHNSSKNRIMIFGTIRSK